MSNLTVACVLKSGDLFTPEYVEKLQQMVHKNITYKYDFVCLTDLNKENFSENIRVIPFEVDFPWKWCKINLWNPKNDFNKRVLYLDLDSLVIRNLDEIVDYPVDFALIKQWKNIGPKFGRERILKYKSPLMVWNHNCRPQIWNNFYLGIMNELVGDQDWIGKICPNEETLPEGWFDEERYYKNGNIPEKCKVLGITHNEKNKGAARDREWVRKYWECPEIIEEQKTENRIPKVAPQDKIDVVCFLWNKWFDREEEYVTKLRNSVQRNLSIPHNFICITNKKINDPDIITKDLKPLSWKGNLLKLSIFNPSYKLSRKVFMLDIDVVITGSLDEICSYDGEFCIRAAFVTANNAWVPDGDMFIARRNIWNKIWDFIRKNKINIERKTKGRERAFYKLYRNQVFNKVDFIQQLYPGMVKSFKQHEINKHKTYDENTRIITFHGRPKQHEVDYSEFPWVKELWR